jgi:hypothetical protein
MREETHKKKFWLENLKGIDHVKDLGGHEGILLKLMLNRMRGYGLGSFG